jgi:hypothetical protein
VPPRGPQGGVEQGFSPGVVAEDVAREGSKKGSLSGDPTWLVPNWGSNRGSASGWLVQGFNPMVVPKVGSHKVGYPKGVQVESTMGSPKIGPTIGFPKVGPSSGFSEGSCECSP